MKAVNRIVKILKIPFKFIYKIGSSPIKFVYNKQKKLIKIISPSNVKIVAVKISRAGKEIIVTIVFIVSIISSSGVYSQKMSENYVTLPAKMPIEKVLEVPQGGDLNHPWSPGAKHAGNSSKTSSGKAPKLRRRRLFSTPSSNSHSRSNFGQQKQTPNPAYKKSGVSLNDNRPKGRSIRVKSIAKSDDNGEIKTTYYNEDGQIMDGPAESKFLNGGDLASDDKTNSTDQQIESETKNQTEEVHHQNSGLTKARNNLTPVEDER